MARNAHLNWRRRTWKKAIMILGRVSDTEFLSAAVVAVGCFPSPILGRAVDLAVDDRREFVQGTRPRIQACGRDRRRNDFLDPDIPDDRAVRLELGAEKVGVSPDAPCEFGGPAYGQLDGRRTLRKKGAPMSFWPRGPHLSNHSLGRYRRPAARTGRQRSGAPRRRWNDHPLS